MIAIISNGQNDGVVEGGGGGWDCVGLLKVFLRCIDSSNKAGISILSGYFDGHVER